LDLILKMIGATLPAPLLFHDMASDPKRTEPGPADEGLLRELLTLIRNGNPGISDTSLRDLLLKTEPFASAPNAVEKLLRD
jgi:hypothetical protein